MICCLSWSKRNGSLMNVMIWMNLKTWMTTWMNLKILRNGNLNCVWMGAFLITSVAVTFVAPDLSLFSAEYCRYFSAASIHVFPNSLVTDCISPLILPANEFPPGIRVSIIGLFPFPSFFPLSIIHRAEFQSYRPAFFCIKLERQFLFPLRSKSLY